MYPVMKWALVPLLLLLCLITGSLLALLFQVTPALLTKLITDPEFHFAVLMSLATSLTSLVLAFLIAVPAAWVMVRGGFPGKRVADALFDIPLVIGIGLLLLLGSQGPLAGIFPQLGRWLFSLVGVIIAQTYVASAVLYRSAQGAFASVDPAYVRTAMNLGLTPGKTLLLAEIPLCLQGLLSGGILAYSRALGEFGATLMLAGATRFKTETLPMAIYLNIASGDFSLALGCALILMALAIVLLVALHRLKRQPSHAAR
ncbi:ABC transporter permease [Morganella morganii]|uniref:ABC transporter permease n=1 Tax=Morganella morganii TaxID=582 RepID=UPI0030FEE560